MSKIENLIKQYCPNGCEWKTVGECVRILDGQRKPITKAARISGKYPYYGANGVQDYVADYIFDGTYVLIGEDGSVVTPEGYPIVHWVEGKIWVNNHAHIVEEMQGVSLRYFFHAISNCNVSNLIHGNIPKLNQGDFRAIQIPVPPLPVQEEIVRILDKFTELEKELEKELEMRKKQYEFYRDKLLTFGDDVERKRLGDVCILSAGGDAPKTHMSKIKSDEYKYPIYSNGIGDNALYGYTYEYKISSPCVTVAARGTIGWAALRTDPFYPIVRLICVLPKDYGELNVAFLKYFIDTIEFSVPEGGIPQLTVPMLKNLVIPVPSLQEQQRIVEILDTFDTLTTDLTQGLPAEIKMRRMQYEYYRDYLFGLLK